MFKWTKRYRIPVPRTFSPEEELMAKPSGLKPGESAPKSGQYEQVGPKGGKGHEVTVPKGTTLPPTTKPGSTYKLVDPTKNKSGTGK